MNRKRPNRRDPGAGLILVLVDVFLLSLLNILLLEPEFSQPDRLTLPRLSQPSGAPSPNSRSAYQVEIDATGKVTWRGQLVEVETIAERMARETAASDRINLRVDGRAPVEPFLEVMAACQRSGTWDRVDVRYRKRSADAGQ